jgi:hypothetical protein
MEKVWARVEEKLDKKEDKKVIALWKKIAVAASLLLFVSIGYQFLKSDKEIITIENPIVIENKDTIQNVSPLKLFFISYTVRNIIVFATNIKLKKDYVLKLESMDIIAYSLYLVSIITICNF